MGLFQEISIQAQKKIPRAWHIEYMKKYPVLAANSVEFVL